MSEDKKPSPPVEDDRGYVFYPNRDPLNDGKTEHKRSKFWDMVFMFNSNSARGQKGIASCERSVTWCLQNDPRVKLLYKAMRKQGCNINLRRHISCEPCIGSVSGGYDPSVNQVVVCTGNQGTHCNVLAHEFVHMYDLCRAKVDFDNIEHLACTEVRAANFMHCGRLSAWASKDIKWNDYIAKHAICVKNQAIKSIIHVRNVPLEKAAEVVDKVFDKCYQDLEPIGRRPRRNSTDAHCALIEGILYGYD